MLQFALAGLTLFACFGAIAAPAEPFKIVSEDASAERRMVAVRLPGRLAEPELRRLAEDIQKRARASAPRTVVRFHLPGMPLDQTPWAVASFQPELKVAISGLKLEEEQLFKAEVQADRRQLVGAWLTSPPAIPGRLAIFRDKAKTFAEWRLRSGLKSVEELSESRVGRGRLYTVNGEGATHFLVTAAGELELREGETPIASGEPIALDQAAIAAALSPAVVTTPAQPSGSGKPAGDAAGRAVSDSVTIGNGTGRAGARSTGSSTLATEPVTAAISSTTKKRVVRSAAVTKLQSAQDRASKREDRPIMRISGH